MSIVRVASAPALRGVLRVPPDKSITHRALLLGSLSDRAVTVTRPLDSEDTAATLHAVEALRAEVRGRIGERVVVRGRGLRGLVGPPALDCANAGTLMRLVIGILVGQTADHTLLDGDDSLRRRPMGRVARPLRAMGAQVWTTPEGTPPLVVSGGRPLRGMEHELQVASAQVKSCLLLAGLFAEGETWVREPAPSRDHTERMLEAAGVPLLRSNGAVGVAGPVESISLPDIEVPGDISSAAFHLVAGVLRADPEVRLQGVNLNPRRTGLLDVLARMGAPVEVIEGEPMAGEPAGEVVVRRAGVLQATEVAPEEVPSLIDELPLVGLLGAFAAGTTVVRPSAPSAASRIADLICALATGSS